MANPALDDNDEKPLDPAVENVRRKMIRFMGVNLGLLFLALMAVLGAIVYKSRNAVPEPTVANGLSVPAQGGLVEGKIPLPAGARIVSQSLSGTQLSIYVEEAAEQRVIYVFDTAAGRMVGRFEISTD
ncbi:MAG: fimbrial protein [Rhizobiaceae bacterium]|nr:fimbrial protein [Rhizobiaceae bacterium]